ncbi:MAG: DUF3576 domain-containing protein [Rickettsiales bacterium]|nr:DUF3576 domain-containing protein [Pseudomonadota bacterium]MDA0965721.1 DUF3576 domain-containing protein [Pseudomonadota bacterium]MDG4543817.1 DUF3576 domain-containing protein [Rickettsiales bacterium]MDG4545964.1 DUF3576 domain-containing protein [Rickettsiales bacterium]MDG4548210.1 DUF3576 domain-containing protein [Rickettsiales bacterium]
MKKLYTIKTIIILSVLAILGGCSKDLDVQAQYPKSQEDERRVRAGKLTGEGGLKLFGGSSDNEGGSGSGSNVGIGINSYLWRATLDTLSFMPLAIADPFGGVVTTEWYEDADAKGERFKVNVLILDQTLHANALKVSVFKQNRINGEWRDAKPNQKLIIDLENKILTSARNYKVEKESQGS